MLHTETIELLNASNKSTHVLCINRKLRSFWVEWHSCHTCRCSKTYIMNSLIHQLHNMVLLRRPSGCTYSRSNHWSGIQVARARCEDARATAARMSLKVGIAGSMYGNNGENFTKMILSYFTSKPPQEKYISCKKEQHIKPVVYRLENSRFHFQKFLCKWGWPRD